MNPNDAQGADLRALFRERRRALPPRERLDAATEVATHLRPLLERHEGRIAGYWAVGGELPLHAVQANLPATLRWCLPVLHEDGRLRFREWSAGAALAPNRHGIPEPVAGPLIAPEDLALALVPLLAFDHRGHRLGQGGGWYDRSFAFRLAHGHESSMTARPLLVGIAYPWQQVDHLSANDWDVPLDLVVTPRGAIDPAATLLP